MNGRKKPESGRIQAFGAGRSQLLRTSMVGITLVGYILAGIGIGYLLDTQFRTSFWTPLLLMVGAVAGFRDMIQTLNSLSREEKAARAARQAEVQQDQTTAAPGRNRGISSPAVEVVTEEARPRPRIFAVPPPPQASFDKRSETPSQEPPQESSDEPDTETELIEKLMSDDQTSSP